MGIVINKCQKCGHEWPQAGKVSPRRCPAPGCRTVKWRYCTPAMLVRKTTRRGRGPVVSENVRLDK